MCRGRNSDSAGQKHIETVGSISYCGVAAWIVSPSGDTCGSIVVWVGLVPGRATTELPVS